MHHGDHEVTGWFAGRLPDDWFVEAPDVEVDREEILVVGTLAPPALPEDASGETRGAAEAARIGAWRDETREQRIRIAREAERRFRRKVAWGARCGETEKLFTMLALPVMTRLRMPERAVLDTLVDAGVARSRSHALAWCVRLVGKNEAEWIEELRKALSSVAAVRAGGPRSATTVV